MRAFKVRWPSHNSYLHYVHKQCINNIGDCKWSAVKHSTWRECAIRADHYPYHQTRNTTGCQRLPTLRHKVMSTKCLFSAAALTDTRIIKTCVAAHWMLRFRMPSCQRRTPGQSSPTLFFILCKRYACSVRNLICVQLLFMNMYSISSVSGFTRRNFLFNDLAISSLNMQRCERLARMYY